MIPGVAGDDGDGSRGTGTSGAAGDETGTSGAASDDGGTYVPKEDDSTPIQQVIDCDVMVLFT